VRFAVVGAGAIGAYVGAALARGGADVTLIARGEHLRAMQELGVQVLSPAGDFHAHPAATDDFAAIGEADVVFIGLKAYSLPELAPRIGSFLRADAAVIAAQNGIPWWYFQEHGGPLDGTIVEAVDPGGVVSAAIPPASVVGCVVYCATEIVQPGVIRHIEGTRYAIGEPDGTESVRCRAISAAFRAGGLKGPNDRQLRDQIWLKLIGNAAFNPVSVLTRATLGELGEVPELRPVLRALLEEGAAVAAALGVSLPVSIERRLEAGLQVGEHKTSMLQDFEAGKPLELDCITGAIIELAAKLGLEVPRLQAMDAAVRLAEHVERQHNAR
jgi:2-dehydropantoate 2-reductase